MPRTFFRNTTALALGLGVALPHFGGAQALPASDAARLAQTRAGDMPELARMLDKDIRAGLTAPGTAELPAPVRLAQAEGVTATDAVPLPGAAAQGDAGADAAAAAAAAAADAPVVAEEPVVEAPEPEPAGKPAPEAAAPAETAKAVEEPVAEPVAAEPVVVPDAAAEARVEATPEPAAAPVAAPEEPAAEPVVTTPEPAADAAAQAARDAAPEPEAPEAPTPAPQAQAAPEPEPEVTPKASAAADSPSEADLARALAERSEGKAAADAAVAPDSGAAASAAAAGNGKNKGSAPVVEPVRPADPAKAAESAGAAEAKPPVVGGAAPKGGSQDAAAEAAAKAGTAAPDAATAADGTSAPVVTGGAAQPGPSEDELAAALAGAREVPEAEARPTDAAREAAAAAAAPAAAALADTAAPVVTTDKQQVTEETARSATEDFLTDVRGTLRQGDIPVVGGAQGSNEPVVVGGDGQPVTTGDAQTADKDDDRSDLEKVLRQAVLPALAGLAVGQLLSNNRQVELNTGDRVVVTRPDGSQEILKDDNALLLRPGSTVQTEEYADGSTRTIVTREDGSQVVTIRDADLRVLRRTLVRPDGTTTALIDETAQVAPVDVATLPPPARPIVVAPGEQLSEDALREALRRETQVDRTFTLGQIRNIPEVRALVAPVDIQAITFDTGSAAIKPDQAQALASLGRVIADSVRQNPSEVYLIEGHTDTVGADAMNLALSDRRAESVALALTEFFGVPPENMVVQGYGEQFLKVPQEGDIRANRRASVRRITDLLARS